MNSQPPFTIRPARPDEAGVILDFIRRLADYEQCSDEVVADEATLYHSLFVERDGRGYTWRTSSSFRKNVDVATARRC